MESGIFISNANTALGDLKENEATTPRGIFEIYSILFYPWLKMFSFAGCV